jgi:tetratricopeptide (TPR) repeat protein
VNRADPTDPVLRLARAEQLLELGRAAEARAQVATALAGEPDNASAQRLLVRCLLRLDDPGALDASKRAIVLAPDNDQSHRLASLAHARAGLHDLAVQHARESVRLAPYEWRTHHVLTHALTETDPEAALAAGLTGVQIAPEEPSMHLVHGLAALKARRNKQAKESFRTVLALDPGNATARNNLAIADLRTGRFGEAMDGFGAALAADPRLGPARGNIDAVSITMLMKLRIIVILSSLLVFQLLPATGPVSAREAAGVLLALWAGLIGWGYTQVPRRMRRYAIRVFRRSPRATISAVAVLGAAIGITIGPLLGLVSVQTGVDIVDVAWLSLFADAILYSRFRSKSKSKTTVNSKSKARAEATAAARDKARAGLARRDGRTRSQES